MDYRQTLQSGTILDGKYRIERVLGSGGFGITYEAYDLGLAAAVAVKEYFPSQFGLRDATFSVRPRSDGDREMFERLRASFLREARTLNQFDHPAIVRVLNVFESHGTAYMVMKYETGPNLKAWLADLQRLPTQSELDRLAAPLLDALEMMHAAEFLHRDIAPDNIIVRADGTPVLLDFGASRRVMGEMTGTLTGVVKKGYSPQEQYATDGRSQGPWTDVYALGATLYRCVSNETPDEATDRMLDDRLLPAAEVGAGHYRPAFLAAIDAAIALRPSDRPQSISAWRGMLFDGVAVPSGNPQSWPTAARTEPTSGGAASAATIASRPARSRWSKAAMAAGLVALIGGGALLAGWDPVGPGDTPRTAQDVSVVTNTDETWRRKADAAQQRQEREIARLSREAELRAAEEARQRKLAEESEASRKTEEARERAAEEARRAGEEEAHKRQLAQETEARRKAEEAHKRAIEEAQQRAAEAARQRKLAEEAEARRLAAEQARLRQEEEIKRLTREAAERAAEETRRQIEEDARRRKLAEEAEARRLAAVEAQRRQEEEIKRLTREAAERAAEETRRKIEEEARQRKLADEAAAARKAEEARSRAAADERVKESVKDARERTKVAALPKLPSPTPSQYSFDGRWIINTTALSPQCRLSSNQFPILIANHRISTRGGGSGEISGSGSVRWTGRSRFGPRPVDWTGTFRANSGSGTYNARGGKCHGRFVARRA